jgi:hypothetical protein
MLWREIRVEEEEGESIHQCPSALAVQITLLRNKIGMDEQGCFDIHFTLKSVPASDAPQRQMIRGHRFRRGEADASSCTFALFDSLTLRFVAHLRALTYLSLCHISQVPCATWRSSRLLCDAHTVHVKMRLGSLESEARCRHDQSFSKHHHIVDGVQAGSWPSGPADRFAGVRHTHVAGIP